MLLANEKAPLQQGRLNDEKDENSSSAWIFGGVAVLIIILLISGFHRSLRSRQGLA